MRLTSQQLAGHRKLASLVGLKPVIPKRIRQGEKPPNKLESDWQAIIQDRHPAVKLRAQAIRFRLANGAWYKPDIMAWFPDRMVCWECKGGKKMKGHAKGMLTIKVAATTWPEVKFVLVWRDDGVWNYQEVLP